MAKETSVDITDVFKQLTEQEATNLQLVLIQDNDSDPYDTQLVIRATSSSGEPIQVVACPSPCNIGRAFNPSNQ